MPPIPGWAMWCAPPATPGRAHGQISGTGRPDSATTRRHPATAHRPLGAWVPCIRAKRHDTDQRLAGLDGLPDFSHPGRVTIPFRAVTSRLRLALASASSGWRRQCCAQSLPTGSGVSAANRSIRCAAPPAHGRPQSVRAPAPADGRVDPATLPAAAHLPVAQNPAPANPITRQCLFRQFHPATLPVDLPIQLGCLGLRAIDLVRRRLAFLLQQACFAAHPAGYADVCTCRLILACTSP